MLMGAAVAQEPNVQQPKERVLGIGGLFFRSHDPDPEGNPIELWEPISAP